MTRPMHTDNGQSAQALRGVIGSPSDAGATVLVFQCVLPSGLGTLLGLLAISLHW
jgi:hypothetical protein